MLPYQTHVSRRYASIMNKKHYYDPAGVFSEAWRRGESWWSLVSPEELASLQAEMKKKIDEGALHCSDCTLLKH